MFVQLKLRQRNIAKHNENGQINAIDVWNFQRVKSVSLVSHSWFSSNYICFQLVSVRVSTCFCVNSIGLVVVFLFRIAFGD